MADVEGNVGRFRKHRVESRTIGSLIGPQSAEADMLEKMGPACGEPLLANKRSLFEYLWHH